VTEALALAVDVEIGDGVIREQWIVDVCGLHEDHT
jgi:hypothetical protein